MGTEQTAPRFSFRAFASMLVVFSFAVLALSGLLMLLWPGGPGTNILGLGRHGWSQLHEVISIPVVIAAAVHLWYNWRHVLAYLRRGAGEMVWRREWLVALALVVALVAGATLLGGGEGERHGPPGMAGQGQPPLDRD